MKHATLWGATLGLGAALGLTLNGCASGASGGGPAAAMDPEASAFEADGFQLSRPSGWVFVSPDRTVAPDTVAILQGPIGDATLAPVVEVSSRPLTAANQRRKPAHILTSLVTEIVQTFDGFEMQGEPEDVVVGGQPGSVVRLKLNESLPDGESVARSGRFYGAVVRDKIWLVRCMGPADGAADPAFDQIIADVQIN